MTCSTELKPRIGFDSPDTIDCLSCLDIALSVTICLRGSSTELLDLKFCSRMFRFLSPEFVCLNTWLCKLFFFT